MTDGIKKSIRLVAMPVLFVAFFVAFLLGFLEFVEVWEQRRFVGIVCLVTFIGTIGFAFGHYYREEAEAKARARYPSTTLKQ